MTEPTTRIHIDVYSDVICPWCYVGKRRLERTLQQVGDRVNVKVSWRPFQLNPTMPQQGMNRTVYLETKFGSLQAFKEMEAHLLEAGRVEQIPFAFEKISRTPNTFLAHRLIWYAGTQGRQDAVVESLFKGFFEEGADIGSSDVLVQLAERADLKAEAFLLGDEGTADVQSEEAVSRSLGIRSVPYFVLNRTYGVSGAQPAQVFVDAIERVRRQDSGASTAER